MTSELGQSQGFWGAEPGAYSPHSPLSVTQSPVSLFLLCLVRAFKKKTASSCEQPALSDACPSPEMAEPHEDGLSWATLLPSAQGVNSVQPEEPNQMGTWELDTRSGNRRRQPSPTVRAADHHSKAHSLTLNLFCLIDV